VGQMILLPKAINLQPSQKFLTNHRVNFEL